MADVEEFRKSYQYNLINPLSQMPVAHLKLLDSNHDQSVVSFQNAIGKLYTPDAPFTGDASSQLADLVAQYLTAESGISGYESDGLSERVSKLMQFCQQVVADLEPQLKALMGADAGPLSKSQVQAPVRTPDQPQFQTPEDGGGGEGPGGLIMLCFIGTLYIWASAQQEWQCWQIYDTVHHWEMNMNGLARHEEPPLPDISHYVFIPPIRIAVPASDAQVADDILRMLESEGITGIERDYIEGLLARGYDEKSILAAIRGWLAAGLSISEINNLLGIAALNIAPALPMGFSSMTQLQQFIAALQIGLQRAGYGCVGSGIAGSAVTGNKFTTGAPFDQGRTSDYDVILADPQLLAKAKRLGISLRGKGTRTGPLTDDELRELGLYDLEQQLSQMAGRDVHFMIYNSLVTAGSRAPTTVFSDNTCP